VCLYRLISKKGEKNNYYVGQKEVLRETFLMPSGVLRVARGGSLRLPRAPRDSTTQRVCSPGAGFNPPEFWSPCGLPVSCCLATSVVWLRNSKQLVAPPRWGPRVLPLPRIFMVLGGMEVAFGRARAGGDVFVWSPHCVVGQAHSASWAAAPTGVWFACLECFQRKAFYVDSITQFESPCAPLD